MYLPFDKIETGGIAVKPIKVLGLTVASLGFFGMLAVGGPVADAKDNDDTNKTEMDSDTVIEIIDQDKDAPVSIKLVRVPDHYYFKSTLQDVTYTLTAVAGDGKPESDNEVDQDKNGQTTGNVGKIVSDKTGTDVEKADPDGLPSIDVQVGKVAANWSVEATMSDTDNETSKIFKVDGSGTQDKSFPYIVTSFKIKTDDSDAELLGTGATKVVAKAVEGEENRTPENNTGLIQRNVTEASIAFSDPKVSLKVKDKLTGTIHYVMKAVPDAKGIDPPPSEEENSGSKPDSDNDGYPDDVDKYPDDPNKHDDSGQ